MIRKQTYSLPFLIISVILLFSCSSREKQGHHVFDTVFPKEQWMEATPESQGIDSAGLVRLMEQIKREELDIDALMVIRNGYLVFQAANGPYSPDIPHRIHSCTKSVVSTLIGIAINEGLIEGPEQPVVELFPDHGEYLNDKVSPDLKLEHLLTMTTGLRSRDSYLYRWEGIRAIRESDDWVKFALTREAESPPGNRFDYSNQASYLLGALLRVNTGKTVEEFAEEKLFAPIGIKEYKWDVDPDGTAIGWGGLWLKPADLARFAWLITRTGEWQGRQIVQPDWLYEAIIPRIEAKTLQNYYGYQWWITKDELVMALGYAGQYAIINIRENLAVVFQSSLADRYFYKPEELYRLNILSNLHDKPLPENPETLSILRNEAETWNRKFRTGSGEISEPLRKNLNSTYPLQENRYGLIAVEFSLLDDEFIYREIYSEREIAYNLGLAGDYRLSTTKGLTYAVAAGITGEDSIAMRELGIGQAYWNEYDIRFSEGKISVGITNSSGGSGRLESIP